MLPSLRSIVGTAKASHMPQSMSCIVRQTNQPMSHVCQGSGSHVDISAIVHGLKNSLCSSIMAPHDCLLLQWG